MKSTKNSYQNKENEKEKAMTTDQVWPVDHFFAPDDRAAKEARKQALLKEAEEKAKEVSKLLYDKWKKAITPEKVIAPESNEERNNAGENEGKTVATISDFDLRLMAMNGIESLETRYWALDNGYGSYFDTWNQKLVSQEDIETFRHPHSSVDSIVQALRACLKQGLVPVALREEDKEKFREMINASKEKETKPANSHGPVSAVVSSFLGQFASKAGQVTEKKPIGKKALDTSIENELHNIAAQCISMPSHFWEIDGKKLVLDIKLLSLYPIGNKYIIYYVYSLKTVQNLIEQSKEELGGFKFDIPTKEELIDSFSQNPFNLNIGSYGRYIKEKELKDSGLYRPYITAAGVFYSGRQGDPETYLHKYIIHRISENLWAKLKRGDVKDYALLPICRLVQRKNGELNESIEKALQVCLENGLVPKDMPNLAPFHAKRKFKELIARYKGEKAKDPTFDLSKVSKAPASASNPVKPDYADILSKLKLGGYKDSDGKGDYQVFQQLKDYISQKDGKLSFDLTKFMKDVKEGNFKKTVNDFDYDINSSLASGEGSPEQVAGNELLNRDHLRANLPTYPDSWLTDENYGSWELFDDIKNPRSDQISKPLSEGTVWMARPPQLDVKKDGICAIDFGTKSTTVVCRLNKTECLLPVGEGMIDHDPEMKDYENPTSMEFKDISSFLKDYKARKGRPFTKWNDLIVSHAAADALSRGDPERSGFDELKQWANDPGREISMKDEKGNSILLKPFEKIDGEDFNPIELYAYYLGLYINNQTNGIYLKYMMTYPVNYPVEVRENIRKSFVKGLKKSLPPAILADQSLMQSFYVHMPASEPAAYAMEALKELDLDATEEGGTAYGVFDFGGGTTDFDFGMEELDDDYDYRLRQFGAGGDAHLGGENLLTLLAYRLFRDNVEEMRNHNIPIILPFDEKVFDGAGFLVEERSKASPAACMNMRILQEFLRPLWESPIIPDKYNEANSISLYSSETGKKVTITLNVDAEGLRNLLKERISRGVDQFFVKLNKVFTLDMLAENNIHKIHIFLAGNSSKSVIVWGLMIDRVNQFNAKFENKTNSQGYLILHPALGTKQSVDEEDSRPFSERPTGKTGVAFGVLRCREEGNDVLVVNENDLSLGEKDQTEVSFPYYLGLWRRHQFDCKITKNAPYGEWVKFVTARKKAFEIRYTKDDRALKPGILQDSDLDTLTCYLDEDEITPAKDTFVYVRRTDISTIQYAVQTEEDRSQGIDPDSPHIILKINGRWELQPRR